MAQEEDTSFYDTEVIVPAHHEPAPLVQFHPNATGEPSTSGRGNREPSAGELSSIILKFLLTVPEEDQKSIIRMMFHIEQAYWFYIDFMMSQDASLKNLTMNRFTELMFRQLPGYEALASPGAVDDTITQWRAYSAQIPRAGGILLNPTMDKVLLIRGTKTSASWGFPRGKIGAKNESYEECAAREIHEETGFDPTGRLIADDFLEVTIDGVKWRMYIVREVDEGFSFEPHCRGEIGAYMWFCIDDLPHNYARNQDGFFDLNLGRRLRFFGVWEFVKPLKRWIKGRGGGRQQAAEGLKSKARNVVGGTPEHTSPLLTAMGLNGGAAGAAALDMNGAAALERAPPLGLHHGAGGAAAAAPDSEPYPGQSWLEFRLDTGPVMSAFDAAWAATGPVA